MLSRRIAPVLYALVVMIAASFSFRVASAESQDAQNLSAGKLLDSGLAARLEQGDATVNVIILLTGYRRYSGQIIANDPAAMAAKQAEIKAQQNVVLNSLSPSQFKLRHQYDNILGFAGSVNQAGLNALLAMPEVEVIEKDTMTEANLRQGVPLMNALAPRSTYHGTGVSVAIVDTGINYNHTQLGGAGFPNAKVIGGYDFGDGDTDPLDCQGHGTAVAGIAAGTLSEGPGDYIGGVAENAKLYALKIVVGCGSSAPMSAITAAWDWAVTHKNDNLSNPILSVNTSFGGELYASACDAAQPTAAAAANNLVANGITLFASSGNDGALGAIAAPACVSNAISVGAVYDADIGTKAFSVCTDATTAADKVTCYSNSADYLSILAPSNDAYTTAVGGGYTLTFGGTSAASPYAAGAGALLQSYAIATTGSPYTPAQLRAALVNNGDPVTDHRNGIVKPRVNVGKTVSVIIADIKANGSDGPITVSSGIPVSLNVSLSAGASAGTDADWWLLCNTPFGWYYYNLSRWLPGMTVTYQAPLFNLAPYQVLNAALPDGAYTCYFGVDTLRNGSIDMGRLFYDSVGITVSPSSSETVTFPATSDTWSVMYFPYWWNVGDSVSGSRTTGLSSINRANLSLQITNNVLAGSGHVDLDVWINSVKVGDFSILPGDTAINRTFDFSSIAGPVYTLNLQQTNLVDIGLGSVVLPPDVSTVTLSAEAVSCGGWEWNGACWYTAATTGMTCNAVCASRGGFDVAGSQHTGNTVGKHFWPDKTDGSDWMSVECSSTDNNTNWGANGTTPDGEFSHSACYVNCACNQ